jgi:hypothetical protein
MSQLLALATLLLASGSPAPAHCSSISGWDQVLANTDVRWIVIGEMHGTNETPAIFLDAVCLTAAARGPITVGLELPSIDQSRIDAFIGSDGGPAAKADLLKALLWQMRGSVSSKAFMRLLERLRQLHRAGRVRRVVAFQDVVTPYDPSSGQGPYEQHLAAMIANAAEAGETTLVLVGNLHARKTQVDFGRPFMPMASLLPANQTITLDAVGNGGMAWNCQQDGCGPHRYPPPPKLAVRGVTLHYGKDRAYDGVLNLGTATTASPPQSAAASP